MPLSAPAQSTLRTGTERLLRAKLATPVIVAAVLATLVANEVTHRRTLNELTIGIQLTDARITAADALQRLTDAETAQRGYLITGREQYLVPYDAAIEALPRAMAATLELMTNGSADAIGDVAVVRQLIDEKLADLATTLALQRAGQRAQAIAIMDSDLGKDRMTEIRNVMTQALDRATRQQQGVRGAIFRGLELRRWIVNAMALLAALGLFSYMQRLREEALHRERSLDRLEAEVQRRTADLRELATHLQDVREDERARLARELHDELGGLLTAAKLDAARIRGTPGLPDKARERLAQVVSRLDEVVTLKRRIIEDLHPSALQHLGLGKSIEFLCDEVAERLGVPVQCEIDPGLDVPCLAPDAELTVYRLVQEALTNVQRYAQARLVGVSVQRTVAGLQVRVQDDGIGFDLEAARVSRHGLAGMRYRVEALGGTMELQSAPGAGTLISATLPPLAADSPTIKPAASPLPEAPG